MVVATAYCLSGRTASGPRTVSLHKRGGCIALSRKLAKDLGMKIPGGGYRFGSWIEVSGVGIFRFMDLMPKRWDSVGSGYRVDIYYPTYRQCRVFGVKRCQVKVVE